MYMYSLLKLNLNTPKNNILFLSGIQTLDLVVIVVLICTS